MKSSGAVLIEKNDSSGSGFWSTAVATRTVEGICYSVGRVLGFES